MRSSQRSDLHECIARMHLVYYVNPVKLCAARSSLPCKSTQDTREYAAQEEIDQHAALEAGMKEKAREFVTTGAEIYRTARN